MSLILRKMTGADAEIVAQTESACFRAPWSADSVRSACARMDFCGLVAETENGFCGYILGTSLFETAEVARIAVLQNVRGQGIGGKILDRFLQTAKERGAQEVFLEVRVSNATAIALYESRGFVCVRTRKKYYENIEDALEMRKEL